MADRLASWLATLLPDGAGPRVVLEGAAGSNGMSSETVLAEVTWHDDGPQAGSFVLRMAPAAEDVPVFPGYRLDHQFETLRLVGELSDVPVPRPRWLEPTGDVLGAPFLLMERVEGVVPPDVMPYTFGDNWLFDGTDEERQRLQARTVETIAGLHGICNAYETFAFLIPESEEQTPLRRHLAGTRHWYEWAAADVGRSPLVDRALAWLEGNWPAADHAENIVLSWGDARIGNVLYRDFEPVAVLDWEMAGLGPRELDLGWLVFAHRVFQTLAESFELPGLPDLLREEDVRAAYEQETGVQVTDLSWFQVYAALIWGVVFMRTGARQVHFGEIEMPGEVDALFHHRALFGAVLDEVGG